ncbi:MAG TPA: SIMPL domain-containing protein [Actinocrinis sp.]|uniref:SIMPL domain-containing protein n=1 Tax=Actinocrinis sp. TaxID=1920516 RepID=UPI002DDC9B65|nr:SIMPL domain-containing protein [Actinocrinis sp.]HEV2348137.1 SIMPL domain-containing protein [Actinocrinis sp.]
MPTTITLGRRTLAASTLAVAAAAVTAAYLVGAANRPAAAPQTVYAVPAADQSSGAMPGITVTGVGTVNGTPDTLTLDLTVTQTRGDVSSALSAADNSMNAVDTALGAKGVASADLKTSGAQVQPNYSSSGSINGYTASESLTATLRDLKTAGSAINAAADAGGNATRIDGVSLDIEHDNSLMTQARTTAFADAKAKAQQYAGAAGESLGKPTQVTETVNSPTPLDYRSIYAAGAASSAAAVPIKAGTAQISVTVTVVFAVG